MTSRRYIEIRPGPPHRHDERIEALWRELRHLLDERRVDRWVAHRRGNPLSAETRERIAAAHRGLKHSPATRARMSASQKARAIREGRA